MPLLATFLGALFTRLIDYFALYLTRKIAVYAAVVAALTALTLTLVGLFVGAAAALVIAFPAGAGTFLAFVPSNFVPCASAYLSCVIAKWVYDWNTKLITQAMSL
jgi:hypothetical protein